MLGLGLRANHAPSGGPPFDPATLSPSAWYREARTLSGSNVTQWTDKSGSALHLPGGSTQPQAGAAQNGQPTISFNGSSQLFDSGAALSSFLTNSDYTIWIVQKTTTATIDASDQSADPCWIADGTASSFFGASPTSGPKCMHGVFDGGVKVLHDSDLLFGTWQLIELRHTGGNIFLRVNGGTEQSLAAGNIGSMAGHLLVGCNFNKTVFFQGSLAELLFVKSSVSDANRALYRAYASSRYGLGF